MNVLSISLCCPRGKNCSSDEFQALGDMLTTMTWELPASAEYRNDLVLPDFLGLEGGAVPKSGSGQLVPADRPKLDPLGPASQDQWAKVSKMVAWFRYSL